MPETRCLTDRADRVNGLRMFARQNLGSAPPGRIPLVLVHGLGVSSRYLVPAACALLNDFPVYLPDLPGYGRSQHPPKTYGIEALARSLCAWMDRVGLEQANLLGNSMGCQVVARFARLYPARAGRLVLESPTMDPGNGGVAGQIFNGFLTLLLEPLSLYPILVVDYLRAGPAQVIRAMRLALEDRIENDLPEVTQPALVIRGDEDRIVSQAWAERVTSLMPDAQLEVIPGASHVSHFDAPRKLEERVLEFLLP